MSTTKSTPSGKAAANMATPKSSADSKQTASKMHRRSRTGCFTCRLRRKKCEEGKPKCKACGNLGLSCEYKRPMWWSNNDQRRLQKETIKNIIKHTKLQEKTQQAVPLPTNSPPSLYHSPSDGMARTRGGSMDSQFSGELNLNQMSTQDLFNPTMMPPPAHTGFPGFSQFAPFEVDIKTQTQLFVNDIETRRDSTVSTFSTYQLPPSPGQSLPSESWVQQDYFEHRQESLKEEPVDFNFFDFPNGSLTPTHQTLIQVEECDQYLLNHFVDHVLRLIFPILEVNQHGSARADVVLPALESNKAYLHCCLSVAALHLKSIQNIQDEKIDDDITRHKFATINELCEALNRNTDHSRVLEAALGMIVFHCTVGKPDDGLPDIPWHAHFNAVTDLVNRLELPAQLVNNTQSHPPFNMTVAAWIDILGATMLGRAPAFADTYREKNVGNSSAGLAELMGCEDRIMFLISEIACLEALKGEGMDDIQLCMHIKLLGEHISLTEPGPGAVDNAYSATGAIRPKQLSKNLTAVFRIAARIYLCSLLPDFDRQQPNIINLVSSLADSLDYIPAGPEGFDRSLVWPLLVGGSASLPDSSFRNKFYERVAQMGGIADFGAFGRVKELLKETWRLNDEAALRGERQSVHWRDVMHQRGWDFLLI